MEYSTGLRVIVHTANLVHGDNTYKSQGLWMQDFPKKAGCWSLQPPYVPRCWLKFPTHDRGRAVQDTQTWRSREVACCRCSAGRREPCFLKV